MKQKTFNEEVQQSIELAQEIACKLQHDQWDVEHILLALLHQEDGQVVQILKMLGKDIVDIVAQVKDVLDQIPVSSNKSNQIYPTKRVEWLFQTADAEANGLKDENIGAEHLFLAMYTEQKGLAVHILISLGITIETIYQTIHFIRRGHRVSRTSDNREQMAWEKFGYSLKEKVINNRLPTRRNIEYEIDLIIKVLARETNRNPLLVGERNIDKISVVEELGRRIMTGNIPDFLKGKEIIVLNFDVLIDGASYRGDLEDRVLDVLNQVVQSSGNNVILFFSELWTGEDDGRFDIGSLLKYPLMFDDIQCIAATLPKYLEHFKKTGLLSRHFRIIPLAE